MNRKTIGLVLLEHVTAVDVTGPAEVFARTKIRIGRQSAISEQSHVVRRNESMQSADFQACYRVLTLGVCEGSCVTECGIEIRPHSNLDEAPPLDTLFVCGCGQTHHSKWSKKLTKWLKHRSSFTRRIVGIGTGVNELALAGLLNGRQAAVHWRLANDFALQFSDVRVNPNALFIKDGPFYSCAGGASAIDLSLSLIEEDFGRRIALNLARELVVHMKRSGDQEQRSEPLEFQLRSCDRFGDMSTWILCNLDRDLSVDALAHRAAMSRRNFTRLFHEAFGKSPAQFVTEARIAEAQQRLLVPRNSIESIATSLGFRSADVFSVAFERYTGIRPRVYRTLRRAPKNSHVTKTHSSKSGMHAATTALRVA